MHYVVKNWYKFGCFVMEYVILLFIAVDLKKIPHEEYALSVNYLWSSGIFCRKKWRKQFNYIITVSCKKTPGEERVVLLVSY
jgi:hypothetical protein